jgi:hypothetical protein
MELAEPVVLLSIDTCKCGVPDATEQLLTVNVILNVFPPLKSNTPLGVTNAAVASYVVPPGVVGLSPIVNLAPVSTILSGETVRVPAKRFLYIGESVSPGKDLYEAEKKVALSVALARYSLNGSGSLGPAVGVAVAVGVGVGEPVIVGVGVGAARSIFPTPAQA